MSTNAHNKYINISTFYDNLLYLLKLNRTKNNQKKIDFFKGTSISRGSERNWKAGTIPAQTTLKRIVEYFNKYLEINITIDDILNRDLQKEQNIPLVVSEDTKSYDHLTNELFKKFQALDKESQKAIIAILDRMQSNDTRTSK